MSRKKSSRRKTAKDIIPSAVPTAIPDAVAEVTEITVDVPGFRANVPVTEVEELLSAELLEASQSLHDVLSRVDQEIEQKQLPAVTLRSEISLDTREKFAETIDPAISFADEFIQRGMSRANGMIQEAAGLLSDIGKAGDSTPRIVVDKPVPDGSDCKAIYQTHLQNANAIAPNVPPGEVPRLTEVREAAWKFSVIEETTPDQNPWLVWDHLEGCTALVALDRGWITFEELRTLMKRPKLTFTEWQQGICKLSMHQCAGPTTGIPPAADDCTDPIDVNICNIGDLLGDVKGEAPAGDCGPLELWKNCDTDDLQIITTGTVLEPPWMLVNMITEGSQFAQSIIENMCTERESDEESGEEPKPVPKLTINGIDVGRVFCDLPKGIGFTDQAIAEAIKALELVTAGSGALNVAALIRGLIEGNVPNSIPITVLGALLIVGIAIFQATLEGVCGDDRKASWLIFSRAIFMFFNRLLPGMFEEHITAVNQFVGVACAKRLPTATESSRSYLSDTIDKDTLKCWVTANGWSWEEYERVVFADRNKLSVPELVVALNRQKINQKDYDTKIRELGYLEPGDAQLFQELSEFIPGPGDLVRFMIRDVDDQALIGKFRLDEDFTIKFDGRVKDWAKDQNIPEDVMKRYWRAHWLIPSPNQLIEMFFRTQPLNPGDPRKVDWPTVVEALKQQDILPFWIDKYRILSQTLLTRVDTRRAFEIGAIDETRLINILLQHGYERQDANTLAEFFKKRRIDLAVGRPEGKAFRQGLVGSPEYHAILKERGLNEGDISTVVSRQRDLSDWESNKVCLAAIRKRYLTGEFSTEQLRDAIRPIQADPHIQGNLVRAWECQRNARGKDASVSLLCKWFSDGRITLDDWYNRLRRLGWLHEDAVRLIADCNLQISDRAERDREQEVARLRADERRRASQAEKLIKNQQKRIKEAETAAKRMRGKRERIQKKLTTASKDLANRLDVEIEDAVTVTRRAYNLLQREAQMGETQAAEIAVIITKLRSLETLDDYEREVADYAENPSPIVEGVLV